MPLNAFSRSLRAIERDRGRGSYIAILLVTTILLGWGVWFFFAPLPIYEVTDVARLEVDRSVYPLANEVAGKVVSTRLAAGRDVQAGEVLVELDATTPRMELEEAKSRFASATSQIERIRSEMEAKERATAGEAEAAQASLEEAKAQEREAAAVAEYEAGQAERASRLFAQGLVAQAEMLRAKADAERSAAAAKARALAVPRLTLEAKAKRSDREAEARELQRGALELDRDRELAGSTIKRLEHEIERHIVRAPVSGRLGEALDLRVGGVLSENQRVGAVVRPGVLRVVAQFRPEDAVGRIRPGQSARIRFAGFPWMQYGSVPISVEMVATEVRDDRIRVELSVPPGRGSRVPLQHGLPGTVEVEVDRITPAALTLQAAGRMLAAPRHHLTAVGTAP